MKYTWKFAYDYETVCIAKRLGMKWDADKQHWWTNDAVVGKAIETGKEAILALAEIRRREDEFKAKVKKSGLEGLRECIDSHQ